MQTPSQRDVRNVGDIDRFADDVRFELEEKAGESVDVMHRIASRYPSVHRHDAPIGYVNREDVPQISRHGVLAVCSHSFDKESQDEHPKLIGQAFREAGRRPQSQAVCHQLMGESGLHLRGGTIALRRR